MLLIPFFRIGFWLWFSFPLFSYQVSRWNLVSFVNFDKVIKSLSTVPFLLADKVVLYYYTYCPGFRCTVSFGWLTVPNRFGKVFHVHLHLGKRYSFSICIWGWWFGLLSCVIGDSGYLCIRRECQLIRGTGWEDGLLWLRVVLCCFFCVSCYSIPFHFICFNCLFFFMMRGSPPCRTI